MKMISGKPLPPSLRDAHRELILFRTRIACPLAGFLYFFTIFLYNHFYAPEKVLSGLGCIALPAAFFVLLIYFSLRLQFIQRHYQLPLVLILGVANTFAASANFQLTGGNTGFFFFPYFLIYLAITIFFPGTLLWVFATCVAQIIGYMISELWVGHNLVVPQVSSNIIYLIDAALLSIVANRIVYRLFLRDREAQMVLEEANLKLKQLDQIKSNFFANISHELKTPLTLVVTPLESILASSTATSPTIAVPRKIFQSVRHNAYRLLSLIGDLLELARSETGVARLQAADIPEPTKYLQAVFSSLAPLPEQRGIAFSFDIVSDLKAHYFDREKIDKVLVNLVGNAVKFTPEGGTIRIRAWDDGDVLHVSVADTGIGIAQENRERVFERFMQVDASSTRAYGGMGIGLSLVKDLVEQHGGTVQLESEVGKGTAITVSIPRGREHFRVAEASGEKWVPLTTNVSREALAGAEAISDDHVSEFSVAEGAPTILVVDDTADMRDAVRNVLTGFHVVTANDGIEGLEAARHHKPDLIITDVMMPRKDGHALVQDLKSDPEFADIPVILLTAKVGEENLAAGFAAGADDYIVKPFQPKEVIARVTNLLNIQRQKRELEQMNQELQNIRQELIQSEKSAAVGILAAGMAHELNNPVAAIRTYLQDILEELPSDAPYRDQLEGAERATERCKRIVADVLAFSQQGSMGELCQINDLVAKTAEAAQRELLQPQMTLTTNLAPDIPSSVVNPLELKQVLMNLLSNARDAIDGNGRITLTTQKVDGRICIEVRDTGSGIAPEHQTKIFDPFFTTKPAGKGMGLGLALCSTMIKRAGGDLQVESQQGRGSCFRITLPITPMKVQPAVPKTS